MRSLTSWYGDCAEAKMAGHQVTKDAGSRALRSSCVTTQKAASKRIQGSRPYKVGCLPP